jgi:hypothetical protein
MALNGGQPLSNALWVVHLLARRDVDTHRVPGRGRGGPGRRRGPAVAAATGQAAVALHPVLFALALIPKLLASRPVVVVVVVVVVVAAAVVGDGGGGSGNSSVGKSNEKEQKSQRQDTHADVSSLMPLVRARPSSRAAFATAEAQSRPGRPRRHHSTNHILQRNTTHATLRTLGRRRPRCPGRRRHTARQRHHHPLARWWSRSWW